MALSHKEIYARRIASLHARGLTWRGTPKVAVLAGTPLADRLWPFVDKTGDCWVWTRSRDTKGYGTLAVGNGKKARAHVIAWRLTHGDIPEGLYVCHHCDNPPCCNPDHLFLGTADDNQKDAAAKARFPRGEKHHRARLTEADVIAIRAAEGKELRRVTAVRFKTSRDYIREIQQRKKWSWLK